MVSTRARQTLDIMTDLTEHVIERLSGKPRGQEALARLLRTQGWICTPPKNGTGTDTVFRRCGSQVMYHKIHDLRRRRGRGGGRRQANAPKTLRGVDYPLTIKKRLRAPPEPLLIFRCYFTHLSARPA